MKVDVFFTPAGIEETAFNDKIVVVIDVLRASTTMITALENGAKEIIPVVEVEDALKVASSLFNERPILSGERHGKVIQGFDLGNSPDEFAASVVSDKSLVFCTTNGTKAILKAKSAKILALCAFLNVSVVKEFVLRTENLEYNLVILCAGKENRFSLEDAICAGLLVDKLLADKRGQSIALSDSATAARILYEKFRGNELAALRESEHGRYLASLGFAKDIEAAARIDVSQALPIMEDSIIRLQKVEKRKFKRVD
ncbi:MAG: 2-phosphosulfolactate phosphatase [Chloroherpetonaceae bacterium]|nr:2-phosphosulfolactate phosphatase [Chloroherpetonaceae bacterium]MDW8436978.1 2-phosphosulfolactate phosphatase [Chloroherpetonaceae bacterium]